MPYIITSLCTNDGACVVNIPAPERYAVHKLIVYGERPISERPKAAKDVEQAAALVEWHVENGRVAQFNAAWRDALGRGRGWRQRATEGRDALVQRHPHLAERALWLNS